MDERSSTTITHSLLLAAMTLASCDALHQGAVLFAAIDAALAAASAFVLIRTWT